jgi:hypothetical protein
MSRHFWLTIATISPHSATWLQRAANARTELEQLAARFGPRAAIADLAYRVLRRCGLQTYVVLVLQPETANPGALENPHGYHGEFLSEAQILTIGRDRPELFSADFAARAVAKGDRCYGIFAADQLISFSWYSQRPTAFDEIFVVEFDLAYVYMYKGYTLPNYRGQHLHALGKARALREFAAQGLKGLVSFAEANNHSSLRSALRLGKRAFGRIWYVRRGSDFRVFATPGCRTHGFVIRPATATGSALASETG